MLRDLLTWCLCSIYSKLFIYRTSSQYSALEHQVQVISMESSEPPRRGPRSTPQDSNKVKKHPPVSPLSQQQQQQQQQQRPPVIIYTDSPKVIHTSPSEFMSTVQRLTGAPSSTSAARNASMLNAPRTSDVDHHRGGGATPYRPAAVLAPLPDSLVEMSSGCFLPPVADAGNSHGCFSQHQFSGGGSGYADDTLFASPGNLLAAPGPVVSSSPPPPPPADCWDPFNQDQI